MIALAAAGALDNAGSPFFLPNLFMKYRPFSMLAAAAVLLLPSLAASAEDKAAPATLKVGELAFTASAPWKVSEEKRPMSAGTITLPGKDGAPELSAVFYHFGPGQGGDLNSNIQRWEAMFTAEPAPKTAKEEFDFGKEKATLVSITGTYTGSRFSPEKEPRADWLLLAAVIPSAEGDVYVRFVGPSAAVTAAKDDFKKLLQTPAAK